MEVLEKGRLTDASYQGGERVRELESKLRSLVGVKYAVAVNSGTAALQSSLAAIGIKGGDEVIVPSFTFVATAGVVLALGAKPVFVDIGEDYNIDPQLIVKAITKRTKALIPVHLYGYPADMGEISEIASKHSLMVVEDAAESLGAEYRGRQTGSLSDLGCFSMYGTKVATSGEGGAVTTNNRELADKVRMIRNHGMVHGNDPRVLGYNFRMQEIPAAIGSVQLDKLKGFLQVRRRNADYLSERIANKEGVRLTQTAGDRTHAWYLYTLYLTKGRDAVVRRLNRAQIGAGAYFKVPVHKTPLYARLGYGRRVLRKTEDASKHVISLPVHPGVNQTEISRVADEFLEALRIAS
jgi:dTDP-4-amino-4,6-dideoxygalactose transaminase